MVVWAAPTARLLGRYLADRSGGPLFLTRWRTRTAPAARDVYEPTGQARLSYRTAAGGVRAVFGGVDFASVASFVVDASGRGGGVCGDVAGQKAGIGICVPCRCMRGPASKHLSRLTAEQFDPPVG